MNDPNSFSLFANDYDGWFAENQDLLESEVRLLARIWPQERPERVLSIGCGTGLFETILKRNNIVIEDGIEPAEGMAAIAQTRGMKVRIGTAEDAEFGHDEYDLLLFNGSTSYVKDLKMVMKRAHDALRPGGYVLLVDVPRESAFGILYCLAEALGSWDHPLLKGVAPKDPYPMPFVVAATWHTTAERIAALEATGFEVLRTAQTLTTSPSRAGEYVEEPKDGHESGGYVAVLARRAE